MFEIGLLFLLSSIIITVYGVYKWKNAIQRDTKTEEENIKIKQENIKLESYQKGLEDLARIEKQKLNEMQEISNSLNGNAAAAFSQYVASLEEQYKVKEQEFDYEVNLLNNSYDEIQKDLHNEYLEVKKDLDKIQSTRAAAMEAQLNEARIKKEKEFYSLNIPALDLKDAITLREIEPRLNNPRVLRMLIWSTFYQKPMNTLCSNVLGPNIVTGIYKITNQLTDMCYIGQSVDIAKRWKDHAKCGLGIDAPVSNKLYNAMQKDGLENFTFELLEKCSSNELNEKEKFFIELYQSDLYGYNSTKGNK